MVYFAFLELKNIFGFHNFYSHKHGVPKVGGGGGGGLGKNTNIFPFFFGRRTLITKVGIELLGQLKIKTTSLHPLSHYPA